MAHLLRDQADVLVDIIRGFVDHPVDAIEDASSTGTRRAGRARDDSSCPSGLQRLLAPEPAALFRLLSKPPPWLHRIGLAVLRQSAEELTAAVADSVSPRRACSTAQEELTALLGSADQ